MKNIIFIYGHLGLGDQIACNGIIRAYTEKYDKVNVFTKPNNLKNVCRMFSDNSKISIISMSEPATAVDLIVDPNKTIDLTNLSYF